MFVYGNTRLEAPSVDNNQPYEEITPSTTLTSTMLAIAKCESGSKQFNEDGTVLRGRVNSLDVGFFQINEKYHLESSIKLGYDIYTEEGNKAYAVYLYEHQGAKPWKASAPCHGFY